MFRQNELKFSIGCIDCPVNTQCCVSGVVIQQCKLGAFNGIGIGSPNTGQSSQVHKPHPSRHCFRPCSIDSLNDHAAQGSGILCPTLPPAAGLPANGTQRSIFPPDSAPPSMAAQRHDESGWTMLTSLVPCVSMVCVTQSVW